jgi:arylsulfatase A-like enzyme
MNTHSRRTFLKQTALAAVGAPLLSLSGCATARNFLGGPRPNIVFILTDDQGYGDLGCLGNPVLQTPNIDALCRAGAQFTNFHVSPVCAPTRSSLMTGRYNYRTGVVDTYQGRAMMYPDEITLPEMLAGHGYRTGIFGKWHLGDNYPMRTIDQGFQESLVHKGGGLCQPSEPANASYFDPILVENGKEAHCQGYCTDIFTDAAIAFVEQHASQPFFAYLATNAPHEPLDIAEKYWKPYAEKGVPEKTARVYGMIANVDENVGKLMAALDRLGIANNTIVIFMTDNGPAFGGTARYNAGLRGQKGEVYEGGIRVPCFVRWPETVRPGTQIDTLAAHIDLLPTLMDACGFTPPKKAHLDGLSLLPWLRGEKPSWPDRTLFFQWHRGDAPEAFKNCAAITQQYKLVNGAELYDLKADPAEKTDVAAANPEIVKKLRGQYEAWLKDVSDTRGYDPPRIVIGTRHEHPTVLTRQDWRGAESWNDGNVGWWEVTVAETRPYRFIAEFPKNDKPCEVVLELNKVKLKQTLAAGHEVCAFPPTPIPAGNGRLECWIAMKEGNSGPQRIIVERR